MNTALIALKMLNQASKQIAQQRYVQKHKDRTLAILESIQEKADYFYYDVQGIIDYCECPMNLTKYDITINRLLAQKMWGRK